MLCQPEINIFREDVSIGDTNLVSMYGLPLLYGNPNKAFADIHSAVITEPFALKLFGDKNAIDKVITFTNLSGKTTDYKVSAVLKALPYNTISNAYADAHYGYAMYIPFEGNQYYPSGTGEDSWNTFYTVSFIKLQPGIQPRQLDAPIKKLLVQNAPEAISKNMLVHLKPLDTYYLDFKWWNSIQNLIYFNMGGARNIVTGSDQLREYHDRHIFIPH